MMTWIDALTDLDFELISMTEDQLHEFATAASSVATRSSIENSDQPIPFTRARTAPSRKNPAGRQPAARAA